jgi:alginate O-acetyltransferase complex protein AlgI
MVNHAWQHMLDRAGLDLSENRLYRGFCWFATFMAVVFAWVYFRAPTLEQGNMIILAMLGFSGFEIPAGILARAGELSGTLTTMGVVPAFGGGAVLMTNFVWITLSAAVVFFLPNVAQIFSRYEPVLYENEKAFSSIRTAGSLSWGYKNGWALAVAIAGVAGVLTLQQVSEFLYFQF